MLCEFQEKAFLTSKFINSWDDWVPQDRLRKLTDDNRELAANLKRDLVQPQPTRTSTKPASSSRRGKGQGSDLGSGRGSEERHSSVPAGGRGTKRGKDNDVEKVSRGSFYLLPVFPPNDPAQDSASDPSTHRGYCIDATDTREHFKNSSSNYSTDHSLQSPQDKSSDPSRGGGRGINTIELSDTYRGNF